MAVWCVHQRMAKETAVIVSLVRAELEERLSVASCDRRHASDQRVIANPVESVRRR